MDENEKRQKVERLDKVSSQINSLATELSKLLIKIGHLKNEAAILQMEIDASSSREVQET